MEGKGGKLNEELDFRSWHCGRQGGRSLNNKFEFRSKLKTRDRLFDHGIVEGKGGKFE